MTQAFRHLARDERGSPALEFVLVLPAALLVMLGLGDLTYQAYLQSVLTGAVQKAGRDSTIQGSNTTALDQNVKNAVLAVAPKATLSSSRVNYDNYSAVAPEPYTDSNHNGVRDAKECFSDVNGNGQWDTDPGSSGPGGASDVTIYKMTMTYTRLFPAWLVGWSSTETISAATYLKNQPYATQNTATVKTLCT
jgi:Flp pilus assembly protein TadG